MNFIYKQTNTIIKAFETTIKTINLIYKYEKKHLILIFLTSILSGITSIISINIFGKLIDIVSCKNLSKICWFILIQTIFALIVAMLANLKKHLNNKLQLKLTYRISIDILQRCTKLTLKDFEDTKTKDNLQYIQSQLGIKPLQTINATLSIISSLSTIMFAICFIAAQKPIILIVMIIPLFTSFLFYIHLSTKENKVEQECSSYSRKAWYLENLLTSDNTFKEVKFFSVSDYLLNKYKSIEQQTIEQNMKISKLELTLSTTTSIIKQISFAAILFIIFVPVVVSDVTVGSAVNVFNTMSTLYIQSENISINFYQIHQSKLYMDKLFSFLKTDKNSLQPKSTINSIENIQVNQLSFKYPTTENMVLQDITFSIKKGETIAIIGTNGSGKSTLIKLLLGFYKAPTNTIYINGIPLDKIDIESVHRRTSILFQDFTKYEITLRENVGFGNIQDLLNSEKIRVALKESNLNLDFKNDIDQQLGFLFHGGIQLSGGQWKKIAIARSFFRDADLYILDEPSASLDALSDFKVMKSFLKCTQDKIGIFITHKITNAQLADKIILMENGKISAFGTHQDLLQKSSNYRELYKSEN